MGAAARRLKITLPQDTTVEAAISFVDREDNVGFSIKAQLTARAPGVAKAEVEKVLALAHDICPFSDLIRKAHEVELIAA